MWLFTTVGFFSATQVQNPSKYNLPEGTIQVRARVFEDLEVLREKYLPELSETIHLPMRDYPYRGYVDKCCFSAALVQMVSDLTYSNFKDEVKHEQGKERADLYMDVWTTMYGAEHKLEDKRAKADAYKAKPVLRFEREALREIEEDDFERDLHSQLMQQERDREDRIARMDATNSGWGDYTDPQTEELRGLGHMSLVDEDDMFRTYVDDSEDVDSADNWAKTWAVPKVPKKSKKNKKQSKRDRRRGR